MSNQDTKKKIPASKLQISASDKSKIKTYVIDGYVKVKGEKEVPRNLSHAFKLINPKCNRRQFNIYVNHVRSNS
ncbi:hypothetical protein [Mangrovimonas cancribranchiae]|uniref:Uncharacterized protein n=1 Tax=Mangrovimonas cancribranchiae TaxID=3080055 RepID=A0AAU6NY30_9FLAO